MGAQALTGPIMEKPPEFPGETPEAARARRRRSLVMALALGAFVILVFIVTIVRMGGHVADQAPI
jgi:hypothetical protein